MSLRPALCFCYALPSNGWALADTWLLREGTLLGSDQNAFNIQNVDKMLTNKEKEKGGASRSHFIIFSEAVMGLPRGPCDNSP